MRLQQVKIFFSEAKSAIIESIHPTKSVTFVPFVVEHQKELVALIKKELENHHLDSINLIVFH